VTDKLQKLYIKKYRVHWSLVVADVTRLFPCLGTWLMVIRFPPLLHTVF